MMKMVQEEAKEDEERRARERERRRRAKTHKTSLSASTQFQTSVILICAYSTHRKTYHRIEEVKKDETLCDGVVFEGTRMSLTTYHTHEPSSNLELYRSFSTSNVRIYILCRARDDDLRLLNSYACVCVRL